MSECMSIPDNWKDFVKEYSFKDKEEIYTNGSELIPVFRVEQMMEHYLVEKQVVEYWYQGYYKLLEELANYKWVSIKDRLPDEGENVLVYTECKNIFTASAVETDAESIKWEDDYGYLDDDVTHWMPLPEPPKEEDADA